MNAQAPDPAGQPGAAATRKTLSPALLGVAIALMVFGVAGVIANLNGVRFYPRFFYALAAGGFLLVSCHDFFSNGAINRMNYFRVLVKYFSLFLIAVAATLLLILLAGGMTPRPAAWSLVAAAFAYLGVVGYYYGARFHQNLDAVEIGRRLGFVPADSGFLSPDWIYDSKGEVNGVETLFNIEVRAAGGSRFRPPRYTHELEVLCYCANPRAVKLSVKPRGAGFFSRGFSSLFRMLRVPRMAPPAGWDGATAVRCSVPEAAALPLSEENQSGVFSELYGFKEMWLSGSEFKFVFSRTDVPWDEARVKETLNAAARLAARFN
ncbi:MAG TPA: hypothetical protein PKI19_08120 [Elusimicrobiales bacterium]|nr:hypothetical protein [Elusimicrobiales bacterium]